jgi:hypothetical protein
MIRRENTQMLQAPVSLQACWLHLAAISSSKHYSYDLCHLPKLPVPFPFFPMVQTLWKAAGTGCKETCNSNNDLVYKGSM